MKKNIMLKWVKALRSGDYTQGRGMLRNSKDEFCCLGVLCNIHALENLEFAKTQKKESYYDGESGLPSRRVLEWSGIKSEDAIYDEESDLSLIEKNDTGTSFMEIADIIEKNWRKL